ncbi:kinase-like protein [Rhizophagus irregularis]|uniref:Kinase-like protein n=1 Tax=Rhizophagus irregularis TaxID=588596 RepID=A0A2N0NVK5_9GLOM|nr:kinase-like protein [Rhizophagus irregularis]
MTKIARGLISKVFKARWGRNEKCVALKLFNITDSAIAKEFVHEIILRREVDLSNVMVKLFGITKTDSDSGLSRRIKDVSRTSLNSFDTIPYTDPRCINIKEKSSNAHEGGIQMEKLDLNEKSDIYSLGVIFWELSSGKKPFSDDEYDSPLAMKIKKGLREGMIERTPEKYSNLYTKCWDSDPDKRPTIQEIMMNLESMVSSQHVIQHFKLNYGLFLDGFRIIPSKQAVLVESGELNMNLYEGYPLMYTSINDRSSNTNLLSFNSEDCTEFNESLQPSDICINFPVAEITYTADLSESYLNFTDDDMTLYEMYGHIFPKRILIGGKLFIDGLKSATSRQIDLFVSFLTWAYDSARYRKENPFGNLSAMKFFPKITTLEEEEIDTPSKLVNWMNNLYQKNMASIISYKNLVPISELRFGTSASLSSSDDKQPGVASFKEKLSLEEWVKDSIYVNLIRWIKELHLVQGLIINKHFELENKKKIAIDFINVPRVNPSDKSYLEMIKQTPTLEEFFISNMSNKDMTLLPFIKNSVKSIDLSYGNYKHFMINCERYDISLSRSDIKAADNFKQAIEEALESMKPFMSLQNVFDEYGYFFPLNIVLGKSLKNILPNPSSFTFEKFHLEIPLFESIKSHLDKLDITYLLTKKGNVIEINDLYGWIQNTNDDLEIVKFDKIISLYDILEEKQKDKINIVLNNQDKLKIIMTGTVDLKDLDINNTEHFKRINIKPSLENGNYEVFGSIISKDKKENLKLDFFITFGLYDINGFSAMIKTLNIENQKINISECYILWMIIGKPLELSVFSPKNRELQVYYMREYIILQPDKSHYTIRTSRQLSQEDMISVNIYCSTTNCGPMDVKFVGWSKNSISFQIIYNNTVISVDNDNDTDPLISIDILISILSSKYKKLKIDNEEKESYLNLIGYILSNENFIKESSGEDDPNNAYIKKNMSFDNSISIDENYDETSKLNIDTKKNSTLEAIGVVINVAQTFDEFAPLIGTFLALGDEIKKLYDKAKHNKELCSFLLKRCNGAMAAVRDLDMRKTENRGFFSKKGNLKLFEEFIKCMEKIKKFVANVSQLNKLKKYFYAKKIEEELNELVKEFNGYMSSLNFSISVQFTDDFATVKSDLKGIKEILSHIWGVSDDSQQNILDNIYSITKKNKNFQKQVKQNTSEVEENEPLLDGNKFSKTKFCPSKRIQKRISYGNCEEYCFKEFSNNTSTSSSADQSNQSNNKEIQIEIRREEDTKYYLVTEWMKYGNLHEYYTNFKDNIDLKTKIKFALDICRGVAYLHECEILHRDIQSANVLVDGNHKVKIANFGLSRKFSDITRNILQNLENIRYMAPEKLAVENDENNNNDAQKKKVPYDSKCEIYSVGALLWEIAELKKPHYDLDKSVLLVNIRKRVSEKYCLPFSNDVPTEWRTIVTRAMEYDSMWRISIPDICRDFYNLSNKIHSDSLQDNTEVSTSNDFCTLSVDEAINVHRSTNGDKQKAWQSFKYHSLTNLEAKYWLGYYYYHEEKIPELQQINKAEKIRIAANIFKETADKGNPSAQLRYGMCLWEGNGVGINTPEALKYLKMAANQENSAAMYIIGKAYWKGGNGIEKDKKQGAEYLKKAASNNHPKAKEMCNELGINN